MKWGDARAGRIFEWQLENVLYGALYGEKKTIVYLALGRWSPQPDPTLEILILFSNNPFYRSHETYTMRLNAIMWKQAKRIA
jgi:hypothetical protein